MHDTREACLLRDGRCLAWTETGPEDAVPLLRFHGTFGSRWSLVGHRDEWARRQLRIVATERPGYGASTAKPGWTYDDVADDAAAVLDHLGIERALVLGISGGAPQVLAFAGRHPDRVLAAAVLVGAAPIDDDEAEGLLPINRATRDLVAAGDVAGLRDLLGEHRDRMLADPEATFGAIMASAPAADREAMEDPDWAEPFFRGAVEALRASVDGWVDDARALLGPWSIDPAAVRASLTWWHGEDDRNVPLSAARRIVERLPSAELRVFPAGSGHLAWYAAEAEILDDLLARGRAGLRPAPAPSSP